MFWFGLTLYLVAGLFAHAGAGAWVSLRLNDYRRPPQDRRWTFSYWSPLPTTGSWSQAMLFTLVLILAAVLGVWLTRRGYENMAHLLYVWLVGQGLLLLYRAYHETMDYWILMDAVERGQEPIHYPRYHWLFLFVAGSLDLLLWPLTVPYALCVARRIWRNTWPHYDRQGRPFDPLGKIQAFSIVESKMAR